MQQLRLTRGARHFINAAHAMRKEVEGTFSGKFGVLLAKRAGRGVARVHQCLAALCCSLPVVGLKRAQSHEHLSPHLKPAGNLQARKLNGNGSNGSRRVGYILAYPAVAAGGRAHQPALLVQQAQSHAVQLGLGGILALGLLVQQAAEAAVEFLHLPGVEDVFQRQHRRPVLYRCERLAGARTYRLGGRIRRYELGMRFFQFAQFPVQRVIFRIRDFLLVLLVVQAVVPLDLFPQPLRPVFLACGWRVRRRIRRRQDAPPVPDPRRRFWIYRAPAWLRPAGSPPPAWCSCYGLPPDIERRVTFP